MTDNEIIKALEYCIIGYCDGCECRGEFLRCRDKLDTDALELIKRQQAEIEQWKEEANKYQSFWCEDVQSAKAEAIKEFADKLENKFFNYYEVLNKSVNKRDYRGENLMVYEVADMIEDCIAGTLEEMVGADNEG